MNGDLDQLTEVYSNLRSELKRVGDLFHEASRRSPNLYFEVLVAPGFDAVGDVAWTELQDRIQGGIGSGPSEREKWFISEEGRKCGRCYGEAIVLEEFERLAITADYLLQRLSALPKTFRQKTSTFESKGLRSWLNHVYTTAVAVNSTLLYQSRDRGFEKMIEELDPGSLSSEGLKDRPFTRSGLIHPECFRLYPDLFLASYEAISIWLDPTSRISLCPLPESVRLAKPADLSPIILPAPRLKPRWVNDERGVLTYGGVKIKEITKPAQNVRAILDAFEEQGWPEEMANPLLAGHTNTDPEQLRNAVDSLNDRLPEPKPIQFGTKEAYKLVTWKALGQNDNESGRSGVGR